MGLFDLELWPDKQKSVQFNLPDTISASFPYPTGIYK
jgi:hypothetical protein